MPDDCDNVGAIMPGWTEEDMANVAAEELGHALAVRGIAWRTCFGDEDGTVNLAFGQLRDAETLLCLAVPGPTGPGTLYDRVTGGCVSLSELAHQAGIGEAAGSPAEVEAIMDVGWSWMVHPDMTSHVVGWHVTVSMPTADANTVTARLNALPFTDDTQ